MASYYTYLATGIGHQRVVHHFEGTPFFGNTVNPDSSSVFVSVSEVNGEGQPFIGDARMYVCNVAVGQGYVDIWIQIDWSHDLPYRLSILLISPD